MFFDRCQPGEFEVLSKFDICHSCQVFSGIFRFYYLKWNVFVESKPFSFVNSNMKFKNFELQSLSDASLSSFSIFVKVPNDPVCNAHSLSHHLRHSRPKIDRISLRDTSIKSGHLSTMRNSKEPWQ